MANPFKKTPSLLLLPLIFILISFAPTNNETAITGEEIRWLTFEQAVEMNQKQPKKVLIDVYTDWCGWCKVMDKKTFSNEKIASYINEHYYAVKFNAEQRENVSFKGTNFEFIPSGNKGYHELAAALLQGKMSYPSLVFLDENLDLIQPIPGFQKPEQLDPILKFFVEAPEKELSWEAFIEQYESPF